MSLPDDYRIAREGCGMYRTEFRRVIAVTGEDRVTFLHGMLSNDVKNVRPGAGNYAALLTQQGKIVSDLRLYADSDRLLLDVPADRADAVRAALEKFIVADDVELGIDETDQPLVGVTGVSSRSVLGKALGMELPPRVSLQHQRYAFGATSLRVIAIDDVDGDGYSLCGPTSVMGSLVRALEESGARPIDAATLNVLRVEAGVPRYGVDMDDDILLMETNLDRAVSFTKGCYLGQEVVERVSARGKVNKKLSGLRIEGQSVPAREAVLSADGRDIGRVTSALDSPAFGIIALGYVHRDFLEPGTSLTVQTASGEAKATIVRLPFVA